MTLEELENAVSAFGGRFWQATLTKENKWKVAIHERLPSLPGDRFFYGEGDNVAEAALCALESFHNRPPPPVPRRFTQSGRSAIPPITEVTLTDLGLDL
jgi:hypothetical protein